MPYLSSRFDITFIRRTRGLWSKTFGVFWKILKSKGDIIHVNYALQDAYLVDKLKPNLDILHVHGSDVRWAIHSKKYGWIVKSNLRNAEKTLYSTPDLESLVKKYRPDAIYQPTPIRTTVFKQKENYNDPPQALYFKLSYEKPPFRLMELLGKHGIALKVKDRDVPYDLIPSTLSNFDIYIDRFTIPSLSKTCLEAMSCGLATIDYRHEVKLPETVAHLSDVSNVKDVGAINRDFVEENHEAGKIAEMLAKIWEETL